MKSLVNIALIYLLWVLGVLLVFYLGFSYNFPANNFPDFWSALANWDGQHFLNIAKNGYQQSFEFAFFPLYPLLIKLISNITGSFLISGLLISFLSSFFTVIFLFKLVEAEFDFATARKTIVMLLIFPTAFFLLTVYSESLFLLLTVASFYFLKKEKFFWASILAILAFLTRFVGVAVLAAVLFVIYQQFKFKKPIFYLLIFGGMVLVLSFFYLTSQNPFIFISAEQHWQRTLTLPGLNIWETVKSLVTPGFINQNIVAVFDLLFTIFGLGLILRVKRFLEMKYFIYSLISILLPIFTPSLSSMPRFILTIFPIFIILGNIKNRYLFYSLILVNLVLLGFFEYRFINNLWVS